MISAGPLGAVMEFENVGTVVGIGGGSGIAVLHHLLIGYKEAGNRVIGIIGAREKDLLILEDEMRQLCDKVIVTTDDGSYGMHGLVTDALQDLVEHGEAHRPDGRRRPPRHDARRLPDDEALRPARPWSVSTRS